MRAPSELARGVASVQWGAVQHQRKVCRGVFWFDTASHGGLVGVLDQLDLPARAIAAGRKHGLVEDIGSRGVWIGEEDCAYATLALVCPRVRAGLGVSRREVYECVQRWHEPFLADVEPGYEPLLNGQIRCAERKERILAEGGLLLRAAWGDWADGVPDGHVRVLFAGRGNREESYVMHEDLYDSRSGFRFPQDATPQQFAEFGEITLEIGERAA